MKILYKILWFAFFTYSFACTKKATTNGATVAPLLNLPTATVDISNSKQQISIMGGDMERSANAVQNATNKQQIIQWGFGDIPFNVCRMQYDKNQEIVEGVKNFAFYNGTVQSMKDIKLVNPSIKFMAVMRSDYDGFNQGDTNNLPTWIYNRQTQKLNVLKYGKFLADYVQYMSLQNVPIDYLATAKEWTSVVKPDSAIKIINVLKAELQVRNIAMPLIMDPSAWSISNAIDYVNRIKILNQSPQVFGFCTHNYNSAETKTYQQFSDAVLPTGKLAFNDETSAGGGGRYTPEGINPPITTLLDAYKEKVAMYEAGLAGEIFFEIWSRGINAESRSIYFKNNNSGERRRAYFIMKDFAIGALNANFIPITFTNSTGVFAMAFKKGNRLTIWLFNESNNNIADFRIVLNNAIINGQVEKIVWHSSSGDEGIKSFTTPSNNAKELTSVFAPQSVVEFKINIL